jgi:hypothetical protein
MISLRLAVPTALALVGLAGCLTYFLIAPAPVSQSAALAAPPATEARSSIVGQARATDTLTNIDQRPRAEEIANAFRKAAEVDAQKQATEAQQPTEVQEAASASTDEPAIAGPIPLPKKRPAARR